MSDAAVTQDLFMSFLTFKSLSFEDVSDLGKEPKVIYPEFGE